MNPIGPASRRKLTWNDTVLGSYAAVVGRNIWDRLKPMERDSISIQELLARFHSQVKCIRCNRYGACEHRDRRGELALIIPREEA